LVARSVGFDGVPSKVASGLGDIASATRCAMPAAATPLSVTSSGLVIPASFISSGSSLIAPKSNWMRVR
jgi:hypothetical protein